MGQAGKEPEDKFSNQAWKDSLPPALSEDQQRDAVQLAREYSIKANELTDRIKQAREIYAKMYEDDPKTWRILNFNERYQELKKRLDKAQLHFTDTEEIILVTELKCSTVKMWTTAESVDAHDGPNNPKKA